MPDNHDLVFDYHEHHDTGHHYAITHQHDRHPRHHHDAGGSVHYLDNIDNLVAVIVNPTIDDDVLDNLAARLADSILHDHLNRRTTPPADTDAP